MSASRLPFGPGAPNSDNVALKATERALRELLALAPDDALVIRQYAAFLRDRGRHAEAAAEYRRALALEPDNAVALCGLGNALVKLHRGEEAVVLLEKALAQAPDDDRLLNNLGLALTEAGQFADAERTFQAAREGDPASAAVYNNLGHLLIAMGRHPDACAAFDRAQQIEPGHLHSACNRAIALLSLGDFERGWHDYQLRWQRPESPHRPYAQPLWQGEPIAGRRILIYTDEGLGDRIQFIRYAPMIRALGGHVICECPMPLMEVFQSVTGIDALVEMGCALPPFDCHAPLLSLPFLFQTSLANVPAHVPYLNVEAARVAFWRKRLAELGAPGDMLVGIYWQGNPHHQWDRFRSMPLMEFLPLTKVPGVRLVSLQRGPGVEQIAGFQEACGGRLIVPTDGTLLSSGDLADTAAIMECVDLIMTVDTATAHLAGALARPVWTLLSAVTDWRWMTERADSPWYPTMRLYRQGRLGEWDGMVARVAEALGKVRSG